MQVCNTWYLFRGVPKSIFKIGLQLMGLKMTMADSEVLQEHYAELADRPFFPDLMAYVGSGPVVCMCWRGQEAVKVARSIIGTRYLHYWISIAIKMQYLQ